MKIAFFVKKRRLQGNRDIESAAETLRGCGHEVYYVKDGTVEPGTGMLVSFGGDGTFLTSANMVRDTGVPVLGVNMGRLGFLSEYKLDEALSHLVSGEYTIEDRTVLSAVISDRGQTKQCFALNEVSLHRTGSGMLGIKVELDGEQLPVYWADGLLVATSSGSTAYSLSAGGPICLPDAKVLVISPIAPHNLNLRPLVVPDGTAVRLSTVTRDGGSMFTWDNSSMDVSDGMQAEVSVAHFSLKRVRLSKNNFIEALKSKLFWGKDVRNQ